MTNLRTSNTEMQSVELRNVFCVVFGGRISILLGLCADANEKLSWYGHLALAEPRGFMGWKPEPTLGSIFRKARSCRKGNENTSPY